MIRAPMDTFLPAVAVAAWCHGAPDSLRFSTGLFPLRAWAMR